MNRRCVSLPAIALLLGSLVAGADTLYLKDGTSRDGKVTRPNENAVILDVAGKKTTYLVTDVDRIEENDRTGNPNAVDPATARHEAELFRLTGLTAEQRHEVEDLMEPLKSEDAVARKRAEQKLIQKGREIDIFPFLESSLEGLSDLYTPPLLDVMLALNPIKTWPLVRRASHDRSPIIRAAALTMLATRGEAELGLVVRGLVDSEAIVVIASMDALAVLSDPRPTPALVELLNSPNPRVRNASLASLQRIWHADPAVAELKTLDQWESYWKAQASKVKSPIARDTLEPLLVLGETGTDTYHNE